MSGFSDRRIETGRRRIYRNAVIVDPSQNMEAAGDLVVEDGRVVACGKATGPSQSAEIIDLKGLHIAPGLVDGRVFVGEPGSEHRETIASAGEAAAAGGVTSLVTMPDTDPVIDDVALVEFMARTARDTTGVRVHPAAALTKGLEGREMTEMRLLRDAGAVAFTDGRHSVGNALLMRRALTYARDFDGLVMATNRDEHLAAHGVMNEGLNATRMGLPGIPREAEIIPLERDIRLTALTGGRYHASTVSTSASAEIIASAKQSGLAVTAGVAIANLTLNENDIGPYRTFFKMSPPLRNEDDRQAMVAALKDGTIDMIVSNHDPQDVDTKRHPFAEAADGAAGLETLFAAALRLYHSGEIPLLRLIDALSTSPARILGIDAGSLTPGSRADFIVFDPDEPWVLEESDLRSRSKNTPFEGARFTGRILQTIVGGRTVFQRAA